MRLLLTQALSYLFTMGGAHKANRLLMEGLAARGHACRVMTPLAAPENPFTREQLHSHLSQRGLRLAASTADEDVFELNGVEVRVLRDYLHVCAELRNQVRDFGPDWVLVPEDKPQLLVGAALEACPSRVVYISHSPATLPFGPDSFSPDPLKTEMLRQTAGVITVSDYMKDYIREWGGIERAQAVLSPVYGGGPFPNLGRFAHGYVTMINPCEIKGLSIFRGLAESMPGVEFGAVRTWGASESELAELKALPNVRMLRPVEDLDRLFAQMRVLLVPSLWGEAFGQVVVEAMLRGIPVLASDSGGLPQAKLGVDYVLPVRKIERYVPDERSKPRIELIPEIPPQHIEPWHEALTRVLSDREHYERLSRASWEAAHEFIAGLGFAPYEEFLERLAPAEPSGREPARASVRKSGAGSLSGVLKNLSAEERSLLARKLKGRLDNALRK